MPKAKPAEWTGELRRGEDEGTVRGWLFCQETGGRIEFTGVKDHRRGGGYILVGRTVPV